MDDGVPAAPSAAQVRVITAALDLFARHGVGRTLLQMIADQIGVTKAAAVEYGTQGIRAVTLCPGFIETEMSGGPGAAERLPQLVQGTALKRGGQPEEVAELAAFLCSDRATYITGAVIPVDGGMTATLA